MKALVTRPQEDAAPLAQALVERGIAPVIAPMLSIVPIPDGVRRCADALAGAQAILVTSANGARLLATASARRELPVFAVGDASAAAARLAGFRSVMSAEGDVEDLAALAVSRLAPQAGALVHAAGSSVAGDLAGTLGAQGFTVRRVALYDAVPVASLDDGAVAALARGEVSLALFFSPRTARRFVELVAPRAELAEACRGVTALALSRAVDAALSALPWADRRVAAAPSQEALLRALDHLLAGRATAPSDGA